MESNYLVFLVHFLSFPARVVVHEGSHCLPGASNASLDQEED